MGLHRILSKDTRQNHHKITIESPSHPNFPLFSHDIPENPWKLQEDRPLWEQLQRDFDWSQLSTTERSMLRWRWARETVTWQRKWGGFNGRNGDFQQILVESSRH